MRTTSFNMGLGLNARIVNLYNLGVSQKEIAVRLGSTHGAVRDVVYRARKAGFVDPLPSETVATRTGGWEFHRAALMETHRRQFLDGVLR